MSSRRRREPWFPFPAAVLACDIRPWTTSRIISTTPYTSVAETAGLERTKRLTIAGRSGRSRRPFASIAAESRGFPGMFVGFIETVDRRWRFLPPLRRNQRKNGVIRATGAAGVSIFQQGISLVNWSALLRNFMENHSRGPIEILFIQKIHFSHERISREPFSILIRDFLSVFDRRSCLVLRAIVNPRDLASGFPSFAENRNLPDVFLSFRIYAFPRVAGSPEREISRNSGIRRRRSATRKRSRVMPSACFSP